MDAGPSSAGNDEEIEEDTHEDDANSSRPADSRMNTEEPSESARNGGAGTQDNDQDGDGGQRRPAFSMAEFRVMLSSEDGITGFMTEVAGFGEDRVMDFSRMVQTGILDAHPSDLMADIFGLFNDENSVPEDEPMWKMAECWNTVHACQDVPAMYETINKRTVACISRLHALIARMELLQLEAMTEAVYTASARIFTMREGICSILEARVPRKERVNLAKLMVRLSNGAADINDFQTLLIILSNKWHVSGILAT
eukprot:jgi/Mesvir1/18587/Mv17096-RA.1